MLRHFRSQHGAGRVGMAAAVVCALLVLFSAGIIAPAAASGWRQRVHHVASSLGEVAQTVANPSLWDVVDPGLQPTAQNPRENPHSQIRMDPLKVGPTASLSMAVPIGH